MWQAIGSTCQFTVSGNCYSTLRLSRQAPRRLNCLATVVSTKDLLCVPCDPPTARVTSQQLKKMLDGTGTVTQPAYPSFAQMGRVLAISSRSVGWWPLLGACGVWLAALAWVRPLASPDETRYTDIPRWMVRSGDWLVPRIDGLPFVHKPPLYFWIEAAFIKAFGISALVSRLPSLGAAIVICACVHKLVNDCNGSRAALWSLAVLLFNPLFFAGAQYADLDMLVAATITLTVTCGFLATRCGLQQADKERALWLGAYATAGFGVLAKGLIGAVLPGLIFVLFVAVSGRWSLLQRAISIPGTLIFAAIVAPWFVLMEGKLPGFAHHFFVFQHFTRYTSTGFNNPHGVWFYPAVLVVGMLPWTVASLRLWPELWRTSLKRDSLTIFALVWLTGVVVFFSVPSSKIIGYLFPVMPAFAILVGPWIAIQTDRLIGMAVGAGLCIVGVVAAAKLQAPAPPAAVAFAGGYMTADDKVVFYGEYYFDVALVLDRRTPTYVVADWSRHSSEMRDGVPRQLTEGREFDKRSGQVLIDERQFKALQEEPGRLWVVVRHRQGTSLPATVSNMKLIVEKGGLAILQNN
jgi:Dolichyl-phosphate-mannose-protein mannosyltransferase